MPGAAWHCTKHGMSSSHFVRLSNSAVGTRQSSDSKPSQSPQPYRVLKPQHAFYTIVAWCQTLLQRAFNRLLAQIVATCQTLLQRAFYTLLQGMLHSAWEHDLTLRAFILPIKPHNLIWELFTDRSPRDTKESCYREYQNL
jgi:hypothetical protein